MDTVARLDAVQRELDRLRAPQSTAERDELARAQSRADSVAGLFGVEASAPVPGERAIDYRRRLLGHFARHSERFKDASFDRFDSNTLAPIEDIVYGEALTAAKRTENYRPGETRVVRERDSVGRLVTKTYGDIGAFMAPFQSDGVSVRIATNPPGKS